MLDINAFSECIRANLKERKFGKDRADKIIGDFEARANQYRADGKPISEAGTLAMKDVFERMSNETAEKAKRTAKALSVQAEGAKRIQEGFKAKSVKGSRGAALGHAVKSLVIPDKRFTGFNVDDAANVRLGHAYAVWGDSADKVLKGSFGIQKGKAHLPNVVREVYGIKTGDLEARRIAEGWVRTSDFLVDEFNAAGGSMRKLDRYLPQTQSAVKLLKHGEEAWVSDHMTWLDWGRMRREDGSLIPAEEREQVLRAVYNTLSTDGINKLDDTSLRGQGRSIGNALDENRFLHYTDAEGWLAAQQKYSDGNIFDVLNHHVGAMTHRTAVVEQLGPNPELAMKNIQTMAKKMALKEGVSQSEVLKMQHVFDRVVNPAMERVLHTNPMNPESSVAMVAGTASNITTAAVMGKAVLASTLGDPTTTAVIRKLNGMPMLGGMRFYLESLRSAAGDLASHLGADSLDRNVGRNIALTSGWIQNSAIAHTSMVERFNRSWNIPNALSRRVADNVLRASGMNILTNAARLRAQGEMAAFLFRASKTPFDEMPTKAMFQRYGITADDWNALRSIQPYNPAKGINMLRPIDILNSDLADTASKTALFRKFQTMILSESRGMVPDSTVEAALSLKGNTRPDTLPGLLLHSFSMFKNFPMTYMQMYSQYAMSLPKATSRIGFITGLTAATTITGSMAVQLSEMQSGRDPMDMTKGDFWLKALLKGGGAGVWGDFLFSTTNQFGGGLASTLQGPALGLIGNVLGVATAEISDAYDAYEKDGKEGLLNYDSKAPQRLVDLMHRYLPGSNLWYTQKLMNSMLWDHIENAADPKASQKRQRQMNKQKQDYGNDYYWKLGEPNPDREPDFSKAFGGE